MSLDPVTAEACRVALIEAWRLRRCAVLIVTHDIAEAASLADRIVVLTGPGPLHALRIVEIPAARRRSGLSEGARVAAEFI